MRKRIYTDKDVVLSFNEKVLLFNNEALSFWTKGLSGFDVEAFTYTEAEMGVASITCDMFVDPSLKPAFDRFWYADFRGERFFLSTLAPACVKDTSSLRYKYTLLFKSERADLERFEFASFVSALSVPQPVSYDFVLPLTVQAFVTRMNINLDYYFGTGKWQMVLDSTYLNNLNTAIYDGTATVTVSFSRETLWSLLTGLYDIYGLRWKISSEGGIMTIRLGYTPVTLSHTFEYGKDKGLVSIERINSSPVIYTRLSGKGSSKNLPYRYFKTAASGYPEDPNHNTYTETIPYSALMTKSYRDYVKGWNDKKSSASPAQPTNYAYMLGYNDATANLAFNPVDYVASEEAEAIYGIRKGSMANNEDIYPTFQDVSVSGLGYLDQIIAVQTVQNDDYNSTDSSVNVMVANAVAETQSIKEDFKNTLRPLITTEFQTTSVRRKIKTSFTHSGVGGTDVSIAATAYLMSGTTVIDSSVFSTPKTSQTITWPIEFTAPNSSTYYIKVEGFMSVLEGSQAYTYYDTFNLSDTFISSSDYSQTFDIWVKNIWGSTKGAETEDAYMHRIWDKLITPNKNITVMFSSGNLAGSDYEFEVATTSATTNYYIYHDESKSLGGVASHWRLSLRKSDKNLESTHLMFPNMTINASAGDKIFFTNIEMPYYPYVYDAESRLELYLNNELAKVNNENPTYAIKPSAVFLETYAENASVQVGASIPIADSQIFGTGNVYLTISNLTIEYKTNQLLPEWNITITEKPLGTKNSVSILQGDVKVLSSNLLSAQQLTEQVQVALDGRYLRKDGQSQDSFSKTAFKDTVLIDGGARSTEYLQGQFGGYGFAIYKDADDNYVLDIDKLNVRKTLNVNELVINQVSIYGGIHMYTAAAMTVSAVDSSNASYHVCQLDIKNGTVLNQFVVNDYAYCQRFDPQSNSIIKYYWKQVVAVGYDYIAISKTGGDGSVNQIPAVGDNIAQLGHVSNKARQSALIIDQTNGGSVTQYAAINGFSLVNKDYIRYGVDPITGRAYERIYGDFYTGGRKPSVDNYLNFDSSTGLISFRGTISQDSTVVDAGGNEFAITVDRGEYNAGLIYYVGNTVYSSGSTYYCYVQTTEGIPPTDTGHWRLHATKGSDGTSVKILGTVDASTNLPSLYSGSYSYIAGQLVRYSGNYYRCILDHQGGQLPTNTTYWTLLGTIAIGDSYITQYLGHMWIWNGTDWTDAGQIKGDTGKGISTVTLHYLVTSASSGVNSSTSGWSTSVLAMTVTNKYLWTYQTITYTDSSFSNSTPVISGVYGNTGAIVFKSIVFRRVETGTLSTPTGGSYASPMPTADWSDGVPSGTFKLWMSTRIFTSDGLTPQQSTWTAPTAATSTAGISIKYSPLSPPLGTPDNESGWVDTPTSLSIWMAIRITTDGVAGPWSLSKIKGEVGATGASPLSIYCENQNLSVNASVNSFTKAVTFRLLSGATPIPISSWTSGGKTLIGLTAGSDTIATYDYTVNLTGFSNSTTTVGYINASVAYLGQTVAISVSVVRVFNPVMLTMGDWVAGVVYVGNCIQRAAVKYSGSWYAVRVNVGNSSTNWVATEWEPLNSFKNVATDTLLAEQANIAGFIYKNQKMISQAGTIGGNASTNWGHVDFVPNTTIDGNTGLITAKNAVIQGTINASSGTFSGSLSGVTGTFHSLQGDEGNGDATITLGSYGLTFGGNMAHQGVDSSGNSWVFRTAGLFCRTIFGSKSKTCLVVEGSTAKYYIHGLDNATYDQVSLISARDSGNNLYYNLPLYGTSGSSAGFPVDVVIFRVLSGTYRYSLIGTTGKKITLINADDVNAISFYNKGGLTTLGGGYVRDCLFLGNFLSSPTESAGTLGMGIMLGAELDNNW